MRFDTPVLFIVFNRPESTARVFESIKKLQPQRLFIAVDGARNDADKEKCEQVKRIIEGVDWDCDVKYLYRDKNVGVKLAGSSAIDWFFTQVEQGIILEDDCLPDQSFFWYCRDLLAYYKDDERVWHISGNNFQPKMVTDASYYVSRIPHVWGWATWRRAWQYYDINIKDFPDFVKKGRIIDLFPKKIHQQFWLDVFNNNYLGLDNGWDFQWAFVMFAHNGLAIHPRVNLISNIGFGADASHSFDQLSPYANLPTTTIELPLSHPISLLPNQKADNYVMSHNLGATWHSFFLKKVLKKIGIFDLVKKNYYRLKNLRPR